MTTRRDDLKSQNASPTLRALIVEDSPKDVKLVAATLERGGYNLTYVSVDTPEMLQKQLKEALYEVILSDYNLRDWTALDALEIVKKSGRDIPFIVVTGSLGDESAAECIKNGATDYILKDRMFRLPKAVENALSEKRSHDERKLAEKALSDSEERYRFLFETNPLPMWIYDTETLSFLAVNDSAIARYGYSREEFLEMTIKDIRPPEDTPDLLEDISKTSSVLSETRVWRHRKKDGSIIDVEITSHDLPFGKGQTRLVLANDVTERRQLELQLRQSQKMEAIGQLAGGIAHDFNNLLTVINGYSELMLGQLKADDPNQKYVAEIKNAGGRAASLTHQLLAFSRRQVLEPQVLDLNNVVANMQTMLQRLIGENIDLVVTPVKDLGSAKADPGQVEQIILNLAVNARDAMPQGGKLTIETANVKLDEAYAAGHAEVLPGRFVMLAVSDTGSGMDVETQKRIFEPFFTTKEKGKGTGLGLSTVFGIVKQSEGHIWVYSEPGHGTTFKVYLPLVDKPTEVVGLAKAEAERPRGTETVLLVEDEPSVRLLVRTTLESNGYHVLESTNGAEALLISQQHIGNFHLLLTDLVMPGISGRVLAEQMVSLQPELKVLFMSGYADDAVVRHGGLEAGMAFIQKPFTPDALVRKVREVLDASHGSK